MPVWTVYVKRRIDFILMIERTNVMHKVEIKFAPSNLTQHEMDKICEKTDEIFKKDNLNCTDRALGRRVYLDQGQKQDYGRFWAAIFELKSAAGISEHLQECFWYNGDKKENLITDFIRN